MIVLLVVNIAWTKAAIYEWKGIFPLTRRCNSADFVKKEEKISAKGSKYCSYIL